MNYAEGETAILSGGASCDKRSLTTVKSNRGFTMVELIVVCAIIGVLATFAFPAYGKFVTMSQVRRCMFDIRTLEKSVTAYAIETGALPADLNSVGQGETKDPWGHLYEYHPVVAGSERRGPDTKPLNTDFDLYSLGIDGLTVRDLPATEGGSTSSDDIVRARNGSFVGLGWQFL